MEKRRHQRVVADNLHVDISDGQGFFSGTVQDLSRFGMKLDDIHKRFDTQTKHLMVIVSGSDGKHFKMRAKPRWSQKKIFGKKVGLEIIGAPLGWTEFVMEFEPAKEPIWDEITI